MPKRRLHGPVLALALVLGAAAASAEDSDSDWKGRLLLGDAEATLTFSVPAGPEAPATLAAIVSFSGSSEKPLSVEGWAVDGDAVSFRLVGLDRPYRFSGRLSGPTLEGTLEREAAAVPTTDLYLLGIEAQSDRWRIESVVPVTDRAGYDNQPHFLPDGQSVLYTSIRDDQADIYRFDLADRSLHRLTATAESEYSPTPLPDGSGFSTVRVEADGTQRLWAFDLSGTNPRLLLESVAPVGYHAWIDPRTLALFVLGEPATLQIADLQTGTATVRDTDIGRSLHPTLGGRGVAYIAKGSAEGWTINELNVEDDSPRALISTLPEREDFLRTPSGQLLMGSGSKLFLANLEENAWEPAADLADHGIGDVTRLAMSPDGLWLVVVGGRPDVGAYPASLLLELTRRP